MIQRGQIYRAADPRDEGVRIQVVSGYIQNSLGASVSIATIRSDGKLTRQRSILASALHESPVTKTGATRRTGWILVEGADGGNADA